MRRIETLAAGCRGILPVISSFQGLPWRNSVEYQTARQVPKGEFGVGYMVHNQSAIEYLPIIDQRAAVIVGACGAGYSKMSARSRHWTPFVLLAGYLSVCSPCSADPYRTTISEMVHSLEDPDPRVRLRAAAELGSRARHAQSAVAALTKAVDDESLDVARQAIDALGRIGTPAASAAASVAVTLMKYEQNRVRLAAVEPTLTALGRLGNPWHGVAAIVVSMQRAYGDRGIRLTAVQTLGRLGLDGASFSRAALELVLANRVLGERQDIAAAAVIALGNLGAGAEPSLPLLMALLSDRHLREAACRALEQLGPTAKPSLIEGLQHALPEIRRDALQTLGILDGHDPRWPLALSKDPSAMVRTSVAFRFQVAVERLNGEALAAVRELCSDKDPQVQSSALNVLNALDKLRNQDAYVQAVATSLLVSDRREARTYAARLLAKFRPVPPGVPKYLLEGYQAEGDETSRVAILEAMCQLDPPLPAARELIEQMTSSKENGVRTRCMQLLAEAFPVPAAKLQIEATSSAQSKRDWIAVNQIFNSTLPLDEKLLPGLMLALDALNAYERERVTWELEELGWAGVEPLANSLRSSSDATRIASADCIRHVEWSRVLRRSGGGKRLPETKEGAAKPEQRRNSAERLETALRQAMDDDEEYVRMSAAIAWIRYAREQMTVWQRTKSQKREPEMGERVAVHSHAQEVLERAANSADAGVRTAVLPYLPESSRQAPRIESLLEMLTGDDPTVRLRGALELNKFQSLPREMLPLVTQCLRDVTSSEAESAAFRGGQIRDGLRSGLVLLLWKIGDLPAETVDVLIESLPENNQGQFILALKRTSSAAESALVSKSDDPRVWVRRAVTEALAERAELSAAVRSALHKAGDDADSQVRVAALTGLIRKSPNDSRTVLRGLHDSSAWVRLNTLRVAQFENDSFAEVFRCCDDPDGEVRAQAAVILDGSHRNSVEAHLALRKMLADGVPEVRQAAVKALGNHLLTDAETLVAMAPLLNDSNREVIRETIQVLSQQGAIGDRVFSKEADSPRFIAAWRGRLGEQQSAPMPAAEWPGAAQWLARRVLDDPEMRPWIRSYLAGPYRVREIAGEALPIVLEACDSGDPKIRAVVPCFLAKMPRESEEFLAELVRLLSDPQELVRLSAVEGIARLDAYAAEALPELTKGLSDKSPAVRTAAAKVIGQMHLVSVEGIDSLVARLGDEDEATRISALASLAAFGKRATSAIPDLRACLQTSSSESTQIWASAALATISDEDRAFALDRLRNFLDHRLAATADAAWAALAAVSPPAVELVPEALDILSRPPHRIPTGRFPFVLPPAFVARALPKDVQDNVHASVVSLLAVPYEASWCVETLRELGVDDWSDRLRTVLRNLTERDEYFLASELIATFTPTMEATAEPYFAKILETSSQRDSVRYELACRALPFLLPFHEREVNQRLARCFRGMRPPHSVNMATGILRSSKLLSPETLAIAMDVADESVCCAALDSLAAGGRRASDIVQGIIKHTESKRYTIRRSACRALSAAAPDDRRTLERLIELTQDDDREVRRAAIEGLGDLSIENPRCLDALLLAVGDADSLVRDSAVRALGSQCPPTPESLHRLVAMVDDRDMLVRVAAIDALGRFDRDALIAVPRLQRSLSDGPYAIRVAAAQAIARIGLHDQQTDESVRSHLDEAPPLVKVWCAAFLLNDGRSDQVARRTLMDGLVDVDHVVRKTAVQAVSVVHGDVGQMGAQVTRLMGDHVEAVRTAAADVVKHWEFDGKK